MHSIRNKTKLFLPIALFLLCYGCSTTKTNTPPPRDPPPILTQDEIIRPYVQLGRIKISREVYGILDYRLSPDILEWGLDSLRAEADKMGADAVILPEVIGNTFTFVVIPSTEYRATGVAIKFK